MKVCRTCGDSKPLGEFYLVRSSRDGLESSCGACCRARDQRYRAAHPEVQARWLARNPARHRRYTAVDRARFPEKSRARRSLQKAVAAGRIVKPDACSTCGQLGPVQGHHDDYSKRLDVRWLCFRCHQAQHPRRTESAA